MKNLGTWITVGIFSIGIIAGFGALKSNVAANDKDIEKLQSKTDSLSIETTTVKAQQEVIAKILDKMDDKLEKISDKVGAKK